MSTGRPGPTPISSGGILTKYQAIGAAAYGLPATDVYSIPGVSGAWELDLQYARIYSSAAAGTNEVHGAILGKYLASGGPQAFGLPKTDESVVPGFASARMNDFERAQVYWSPGTGARIVYGAILVKYKELTANSTDYSVFGLPITDETAVPGYYGRKTELSGATIYWSGYTGAHEVRGAIRGKWLAAGGPARFGLPTSDEMAAPGRYQRRQV